MKQRLKFMIISFLFFVPFNIYANSVSIKCDNSVVKKGESTNCYLNGSGDTIAGVSAKISSDSSIIINSISNGTGWVGNASGGSLDYYTDVNKNDNFNIAKINITINGNGSLKANNVIFVDGTNFENHNVSSASTKLSLENIQTTTKIVVTSNAETTTEKVNNKAVTTTKVENTTSVATTTNSNNINNIIHPIDNIYINGIKIQLKENIFNYNLDLNKEFEKANIDLNIIDNNYSFIEGFGPRTIELKDGNNEILVSLIDNTGKKLDYNFAINKTNDTDESNNELEICDCKVEGIYLSYKLLIISGVVILLIVSGLYIWKKRGKKINS